MNSFWGNLYDWSKDRRYAALFFLALIIFLGLAIPGVLLYRQASTFGLRVVYLLPGTCVLVTALAWMTMRYLRSQRRDASNHPPLSRDELAKARSKLLKDRNIKRYERSLHFGSGGDCGVAGVQRGGGGGGDVARLSGRSRSRH